MSLRPVHTHDKDALLAFLQCHEATSLFAMSNIHSGVAMPSWLCEREGRIEGFVGLTASGTLLPQWPQGDWCAARNVLAGQAITAVLGDDLQCQNCLEALGLGMAPKRLTRLEKGYSLTLDALKMPPVLGFHLAALRTEDTALCTAWRTRFNMEVLALDEGAARALAEQELVRWLQAKSHWLLWHGKLPVSLCGFNVMLPEVGQVGGVFTPPELRGQGLARVAVALMLQQAKGRGMRRARLSAASDQAARAYIAIGFEFSHHFSVTLLQEAQTIAP